MTHFSCRIVDQTYSFNYLWGKNRNNAIYYPKIPQFLGHPKENEVFGWELGKTFFPNMSQKN